MSDNLTLADLRTYNNERDAQGWRKFPMTRPSTLADLVEVIESEGGERMWMCWYAEFNDPACYVGHPNPEPAKASQPRKHANCGWVMVLVAPEGGTDE